MAVTRKTLLDNGTAELATKSASARLDAELLLCHALGINRARLYANPDQTTTDDQTAKYSALVAERASGRPLAHLTGHREFWSLGLIVTPDVLVPRPETELLVEKALEHIGENDRVVDLGCGSGAIGIAIATENSTCELTATDNNTTMLEIAARNAATHCDGRIRFLCGDWFAPLDDGCFDMIVTNPPYVATDSPHADQGLRFEPAEALYSGPDGLNDIRVIVAGAPDHLKPGGWLLIEHGFDQADSVAGLLEAAGFENISTHEDLAGHPRVTEGQIANQHG